jgi:hypothetical protein
MRKKMQYGGDKSYCKGSPYAARIVIAESDKKARGAAQIGRIFASYVEDRGCFIGSIIKTNKSEFVVKTRAGNIVKLPYSYALSPDGFRYNYSEWDALASVNDTVSILP